MAHALRPLLVFNEGPLAASTNQLLDRALDIQNAATACMQGNAAQEL